MSLSKAQIKFLRGLAQNLSPYVMVGKDGVTDAVTKELKRALLDHELVKVKVQEEEKEDFVSVAQKLSDIVGAELVQKIGRMAVYFSQQPDPDKRKIRLPRG